MNADIKAQLQKVDGMEVMDVAPVGATILFGTFYRDELGLLIRTARELRERSKHVIAPTPDGEGFAIFNKPAKGPKP